MSARAVAILQAYVVTVLWATSWVLVKYGLRDIPPLYFAALRYTLAFDCLLLLHVARPPQPEMPRLTRRTWLLLLAYGVPYYGITQATVFLGLVYLPTVTASLLFSFTPLIVSLLGIIALGERPTRGQWLGIALYLAGVAVYFRPSGALGGPAIGFAIVGVGVLSNALSAVLGRYLNRPRTMPAQFITMIAMGIGSLLLLVFAARSEPAPPPTLMGWALVGWLAVVNTAVAFTLWAHTLRTLTAVESSIINNAVLINMAILAWFFLDEPIGWLDALGLLIVAAGGLVVQLRRPTRV